MPPSSLPGMIACPLRQNENEHDHKDREDHRGNWTTECKPAMVEGFVEEIANGGAKRSSEDKRGPEHGVIYGEELPARRDEP